jgi:hypothetical protein
MFKYYRGAILVAALALVVGFFLGGWAGVAIVAVLGVLETSLSFDNSVVDASIIKNWSPVWRNRFLTFGMPVAVFGMRFAFPLLIVAVVANMGPINALLLAIHDPKQYESILTSVHNEISAFGGAFLMMLFLKFFFDEEKEIYWVSMIEKPLSMFIAPGEKLAFITAGVAGLMAYVAADGIGALVGGDSIEGGKRIIKEGIVGLMYVELIDATFSFDGVIAAFALTNNVFVMMVGLAIGAMAVRSMTLHLVDKGALSEFRYLEHGAFWAIGILAIIMFVGTSVHVPEVVTGLVGACAIAAALYSSIRANRLDASVEFETH